MKGSPDDDEDEGEEEEEELQPGQQKCEFCHIIGDRESFLPPSRRFCSITCCKRYSAEKRYYPYGRDAQGIAKSIREGLLNPRSRHLRGGATKVRGNGYNTHDKGKEVEGRDRDNKQSLRALGGE